MMLGPQVMSASPPFSLLSNAIIDLTDPQSSVAKQCAVEMQLAISEKTFRVSLKHFRQRLNKVIQKLCDSGELKCEKN